MRAHVQGGMQRLIKPRLALALAVGALQISGGHLGGAHAQSSGSCMYVKPANKVKECGAQCFDGRDNDGDGKIDCSDPDCINNDSTCEHDPHQQTTRTSIPLHAAAVHHDSLPEAEML